MVTANDYPLRADSDPKGRSWFRGEIARVSLFRGKLAAEAIRSLAAGDRTKRVTLPNVAGSWLNPKAGDVLPTRAEDFGGAVSFEAWIFPA